MPKKIIDMTGQVFGTREVIALAAPVRNANGQKITMWLTRCKDCGVEKVLSRHYLLEQYPCRCKQKAKRNAYKKTARCPYNDGVDCEGGNCDKCGWKRSAT